MPHVTGLGTWFAPGSAAAANNASDDIDTTLKPGSDYFDAGLVGQPGADIVQGANNLQNVGANFDPMDHDGAALGALSTQYLSQYLGGGGQLTDATKAQAGADLARMNTSQLRQGSQEEAAKVGSTQQNEASFNAGGATDMRASEAALALKKAAMQMLISHTNNMTAIERGKLTSGVANLQSSAQQVLQGGANDARSNQMSIFESGRLAGANTAVQIGTGIAGGAAQIAGTVGQYMNSPVEQLGDSDIQVTGSGQDENNNGIDDTTDQASVYDGATPVVGAGLLASANSRLALTSNVSNYSPFGVNDSNTAYPLASAWGMTSLASTMPS